MKVTIQNIEPELVFDIKGVRLYRYKYPHFGYFDWSGLSKTLTKRRDLDGYSRRGCSDYIYRMCITKEGMDNLNNDTSLYRIEQVTGQKVREDFTTAWRYGKDDDITFTDWSKFSDVVVSEVYYKISDYHDDPVLTDFELEQQRIVNRDKLLEGLFGNTFRALGEKYGFEFKRFKEGYVDIGWSYDNNFFAKEIEKLIDNTIIKDLNDLGFDAKVCIYDIKYALSHEVIHSIKARDDLFEEEKADESNIKRGEN